MVRYNVQRRLIRPTGWLNHRRISAPEDKSHMAKVPAYGYRRAVAIGAHLSGDAGQQFAALATGAAT